MTPLDRLWLSLQINSVGILIIIVSAGIVYTVTRDSLLSVGSALICIGLLLWFYRAPAKTPDEFFYD